MGRNTLYSLGVWESGKIKPIGNPFIIQKDGKIRNVVCDKNKVHEDCIYGAPDFVLEVTSPSSTHKDMVIKLDKYRSAGVRDYWVVDPKKRFVITYLFEDPIKCGIYGFDSRIPVGICDGFSVDFAEIAKGIG